jgi:flavin-dependent dehydrogenase
MSKKSLKILGAGPAGLAAAITAAHAGRDVDVYERHNTIGKRFGGDMQGLENWSQDIDIIEQLNSMGIKINFDCDPFDSFIITDGIKQSTATFDRPIFYLVKRGPEKGTLDTGLLQQAQDLGVKVHFNTTIATDAVDIIASGPQSKEAVAIAKGIVFKTSADDCAYALTNEKAAIKGYSYLLITKGYGCMCTVIFDDFKKVGKCFETTKKIFNDITDIDIIEPRDVGGIGNFSSSAPFATGNTTLAGEAAGLQDFLWGFGMRTAMTSGNLAAKAYIEDFDYKSAAEKEYADYLKAGVVNRYIWEKLGNTRYHFLKQKLVKNKKPRIFLKNTFNLSTTQKIIYPLAKQSLK